MALLALTVCLPSMRASAQTVPPSHAYKNPNGLASGWPLNANIKVYIDANVFPLGSPAAQGIMQGFFNDAIAYANQGVNYSFQSVTNPPTLGSNETYVTAGYFPSSGGTFGSNTWNYDPASSAGVNTTISSTILLSSSIVGSPDALTYATAHEESHDYFLGDCPDCDGDSTIMTYQNDIFDPPFEGPTANDENAQDSYSGGDGGAGGQPCGHHACPVQD